MKKRKVKLPFKFIITGLFIIVSVCFAGIYLWGVFKNADFFKVKEIMVRGANIDKDNLSYLMGRNIFDINLKRESRSILEAYPDYSRVDLVRVLPGRLVADFVSRQPLALIKLYKYFAVDKDSVLFDAPVCAEGTDLPIITGLETKIFGPKAGRQYNIKELDLALSIIREMRLNRLLKRCRIKRIDVKNIVETSLFIPLNAKLFPALNNNKGNIAPELLLEVKLGQDNVKEKVVILAGLLLQTKSDLADTKYIDLRFKEPVMKPKEKK